VAAFDGMRRFPPVSTRVWRGRSTHDRSALQPAATTAGGLAARRGGGAFSSRSREQSPCRHHAGGSLHSS
jgi:hypothetical protein